MVATAPSSDSFTSSCERRNASGWYISYIRRSQKVSSAHAAVARACSVAGRIRTHWHASNPIVNQVGPSSPSMEMGPSRLINIWLSCKFTQNGFHDSQNKNHRFQLRTQPKLLDLNELINRKRAPNRHVQNLQTWTWPGDGPKPPDLNTLVNRKRVL